MYAVCESLKYSDLQTAFSFCRLGKKPNFCKFDTAHFICHPLLNLQNLNFKYMSKQIRTIIVSSLLVSFIFSSVQLPAFAQIDPMPWMPKPGVMVYLSPEYTPAYLKGIVIHPENPFKFDFITYRGDKPLTYSQKKEEYTKLTKYFLASLAIPDDNQWVNLSPYEKARIIKNDFGKTEMGRDLLAQDYLLKQITASMIYPQDSLGKKFWDKVYAEAQKQCGTTNFPVDTFNKVWILPDDALIYEKGNTAYVLKNHLRVMLEEDYLSLQKHSGIDKVPTNKTHSIVSKIVREIVLPKLQKEVNEGANFASLRQIYSGMLLATWFKRTLKQSVLSQIYANKVKVKGIDQDPKTNEEIYHRYLQAYKKGVFNFIKEDTDRLTNETIPRKYFSGGATGDYAQAAKDLGMTAIIHIIHSLNPTEEIATRIVLSDTDVVNETFQTERTMTNAAMIPGGQEKDAAINAKENEPLVARGEVNQGWIDSQSYYSSPTMIEFLNGIYSRTGPLRILDLGAGEKSPLELFKRFDRNTRRHSRLAAVYALNANGLYRMDPEIRSYRFETDESEIVEKGRPDQIIRKYGPKLKFDIIVIEAPHLEFLPDYINGANSFALPGTMILLRPWYRDNSKIFEHDLSERGFLFHGTVPLPEGYPEVGRFYPKKPSIFIFSKPAFKIEPVHAQDETTLTRKYIQQWIEALLNTVLGPETQQVLLAKFLGINVNRGGFIEAFQRLWKVKTRFLNEELRSRIFSELIAMSPDTDLVLKQQVRFEGHNFQKAMVMDCISQLIEVNYKRTPAVDMNDKFGAILQALREHGRHQRPGFSLTMGISSSDGTIPVSYKETSGLEVFELMLITDELDKVDSVGDNAMKGGIDMNAANLAMTIKRDGNGIPILSQQDLAQFGNIEGLDPVILSIKPASQSVLFTQLIGQH
jgi:hypothetical protein